MTKVETPFVLRTDEGSVCTLTLNRGEQFNPLSSAMIAALQAELDAVAADESVRAMFSLHSGAASARVTISRRCAPMPVTPHGSGGSSTTVAI